MHIESTSALPTALDNQDPIPSVSTPKSKRPTRSTRTPLLKTMVMATATATVMGPVFMQGGNGVAMAAPVGNPDAAIHPLVVRGYEEVDVQRRQELNTTTATTTTTTDGGTLPKVLCSIM